MFVRCHHGDVTTLINTFAIDFAELVDPPFHEEDDPILDIYFNGQAVAQVWTGRDAIAVWEALTDSLSYSHDLDEKPFGEEDTADDGGNEEAQ